MAKQSALPKIFLSVSKRTFTPWAAIIGVVFVSMIFIFLGDLQTVANLTNFTIFVVFILVNSSVIYFRYKKPLATAFQVPGNIGKFPLIPVLGVITSFFMITNLQINILILGGLLIVLGLIFQVIYEKLSKG
jgi:APA family basic amino acid/polyamine antiporter